MWLDDIGEGVLVLREWRIVGGLKWWDCREWLAGVVLREKMSLQ
jgi:hypothetical protein